MTWKAPEMCSHENLIDGESDMSWNQFHELVRKRCGAFLKLKGEKDLREIMENSIRLAVARRRNPNRDIDEYFEYMEENVYNNR